MNVGLSNLTPSHPISLSGGGPPAARDDAAGEQRGAAAPVAKRAQPLAVAATAAGRGRVGVLAGLDGVRHRRLTPTGAHLGERITFDPDLENFVALLACKQTLQSR